MPTSRVRARSASSVPAHLAPRKPPQQERSRALVDAVLVAAGRVLVERGFEGMTTKRVAKLAGISIGSLYQYFPDKLSLLAALIERQSELEMQHLAETMQRVPTPHDPAELVAHLIRAAFAFRARDPALHKALLRNVPRVGHHESLVRKVAHTAEGMRALLAPLVAPAELAIATHVMTNAVHAITHSGILPQPDWLSDEALADEAMRLIRGYLFMLSPSTARPEDHSGSQGPSQVVAISPLRK